MKVILCLILFFYGYSTYSQSSIKKIEKKYSVNDQTVIILTNSYGKVIITPTLKKQVQIEVIQKGSPEEKMSSFKEPICEENKKVNEIAISINAEENFNKENKSSLIYHIQIPIFNSLFITTKYGAIDLGNFQGDLTIQANYSKIKIDTIEGNKISLLNQYGKMDIAYIRKGTLEMKYSNTHIIKSDSLSITNTFSQLQIDEIKDLYINSKHGKIFISQANTVNGNSNFSKFQINYLITSINMNTSYAPLFKINKLGDKFSLVEINGAFQPIYIKLNTQSAHVNVETIFGKLIYKFSDFSFQEQINNTTSNIYKGFYKTNKSKAKITISNKYGNVTFD